ncbi:MAG: GNAT family N-acetyltransferase [Acidimicrobiales bacterium]|nr:GNAT family N-acetyltransferase [Acidimicrobiales bacterium]
MAEPARGKPGRGKPGRKKERLQPPDYRIIDLPERHEATYFSCLEDWSEEMLEAGDHKQRWYERWRDEGLRVKLAVTDDDQAIGMIQYVPIEQSPAVGVGLYMVLCIWVHGHKEGVGKQQGHGAGTALIEAAEADAKALGATGLAAWGLRLPVWMKASWFKKHGYRRCDSHQARDLLWKPFVDDAEPPAWPEQGPIPVIDTDRVDIVAFKSGWCPASNLVYERARRAADTFGDAVSFTTIDINERPVFLECGRADQVLVDGKPLQRGAPPSAATIERKIGKRVDKHQKK